MARRRSRADELTTSILDLNRRKTAFASRFLEQFSDRDSSSPNVPASQQSFVGGIGGSTAKRASSPAKFEAPEFDEERFREISREESRPGEIALRRELDTALKEAQSDNPFKQTQLQKGIFAGFEGAFAANQQRAREVGFKQANVELAIKLQEAQANFQAELIEDEREFQEGKIEEQEKNARAARGEEFIRKLALQKAALQRQFLKDIFADLPTASGGRRRSRSRSASRIPGFGKQGFGKTRRRFTQVKAQER